MALLRFIPTVSYIMVDVGIPSELKGEGFQDFAGVSMFRLPGPGVVKGETLTETSERF